MANDAIRRIVELLGVVGVVGSLIFVGLEVRQNSVSISAATNASVAAAYIDVNLMLASSPELARAMATNGEYPEAAPPEDAIVLLALWRALFHTWSNAHRQHLNGTLDEAIYESVLQEISTYASDAPLKERDRTVVQRRLSMRWAWKNERFLYNPDFRLFVDRIVGITD